MNGANSSNSASSSGGTNDILHLLLQQQYQLTQQQQQFRWHQQQYLGSHANRQPNHDDLFEMAGMLLSDPSSSASNIGGNTPRTGSHQHDSMSLGGPIHTITPANSIRGDESDMTTARATLSTTTTTTSTRGMNQDVGLFDEDELDEVLGGKETTTKNDDTKPMTTPKTKKGPGGPVPLTTPLPSPVNFLAEKTLDEILHSNPRKRSPHDEESPLSASPNMDDEAEWYLIDFGDDNEQHPPDFLSEGERPIKRSRSFETHFSEEY